MGSWMHRLAPLSLCATSVCPQLAHTELKVLTYPGCSSTAPQARTRSTPGLLAARIGWQSCAHLPPEKQASARPCSLHTKNHRRTTAAADGAAGLVTSAREHSSCRRSHLHTLKTEAHSTAPAADALLLRCARLTTHQALRCSLDATLASAQETKGEGYQKSRRQPARQTVNVLPRALGGRGPCGPLTGG
jgi:hypothetical protein